MNTRWGAALTDYLREASGSHYSDGISAPAGTNRPSARLISNILAAQGDVFTEDVIDTWIWYKRTHEAQALRERPHPWEFAMYFDC